jgi:uncharacterized membrane protein YuzA (DUF378 family)
VTQFDLVATLFGGSASAASRVVYSRVGLAGVLLVVLQAAPAFSSAGARTSAAMR